MTQVDTSCACKASTATTYTKTGNTEFAKNSNVSYMDMALTAKSDNTNVDTQFAF